MSKRKGAFLITTTTHLHCHSLLQGKASQLAAIIVLQWVNLGHKQDSANVNLNTGRSSSGLQCVCICNPWLPDLCMGCQGRQRCTLTKKISQLDGNTFLKPRTCYENFIPHNCSGRHNVNHFRLNTKKLLCNITMQQCVQHCLCVVL